MEGIEAVARLWAQLRIADRARYMERAAQAVLDDFDDVCLEVAAESQRPPAEIASLELLGATDALGWLSEQAERLLGARRFALPRALHPLARTRAGSAPLGVVGVAGAPGAPFAAPLVAVAGALLAGNGVVLAPATDAARAAARAVSVLARAGLPEGIVQLGTRADLERCAATLDLAGGPAGPDVMIVLADAHVGRAAAGALWAACAGAGQLPGSLKRVYVAAERHEELLEALVRGAGELEPGDPLAAGTQLGPLAGEPAASALEAAIADALARGAVALCGGRRRGALFAPSVLDAVDDGAQLARARVGGPVLAVARVGDGVEAAARANGAPASIGASIWCADRRHAVRVARELRARVVYGNDHVPALPPRVVAAEALERCVRPQLISWEPTASRQPWRFRYETSTPSTARTVAGLHASFRGRLSGR